jgi:hypothetical protein
MQTDNEMCFLDQLRSSSAPDLTLAITAGVPKEAVDAYSAAHLDSCLKTVDQVVMASVEIQEL